MSPLDDDLIPGARKRSNPAPPPAGGKPPAKPATKPAPGAAPPGPPVAERAGPEDVRLAWGHVGSITRPGRLSDGTSRPGVIRVVEANIQYDPPPLDPYVWVQASSSYVGQFEMFWTEGNPAEARSLADLAAEFHRAPPDPARLQLLDAVADTLLGEVQKLHAHDCRAGLLHLGNVLIVPRSEGRRLILSDLGFVWRGSHGAFPWRDSPGRPRWLEDDPRQNPNARLWDEEPAWKQFSSDASADGEKELVPAQSDLRNLARVFAAVLTGRIERDIPTLPTAAPTWGVLKEVMKGEITTAEQFRTRLADHPLSEHWSAPKGPPPKPAGKMPAAALVGCLGLLGLGGLGAGAALYLSGAFDQPPANTGNDVARIPGSSRTQPTSAANPRTRRSPAQDLAQGGKAAAKAATNVNAAGPKTALPKVEVDWKNRPATMAPEIADLLKQLDAAKNPASLLEALLKLYEFYARSDEPTRARILPWVEYWRGRYGTGWEERYRTIDGEAIKSPALRFDAGRRIQELNREMTGLRDRFEPISPSLNERENQCLLISELRSRELGVPR